MSDLIGQVGSAIVGSATELIVGATGGWLAQRLKSSQPKATETEQARLRQYFGKLTRRVASLEVRFAEDHMWQERIASALEDSDFWALYHEASANSSRTADTRKHEILARAVAERLCSENDSADALARALAISAVKHLTASQLSFLAVAALIFAIRPQIDDSHIAPSVASLGPNATEEERAWYIQATEARGQQTLEWVRETESAFVDWLQRISVHVGWDELTPADIAHLGSVSCLSFNSAVGKHLEGILDIGRGRDLSLYLHLRNEPLPVEEFLWRNDTAKQLRKVWESTMQYVTLTPAGLFIGTSVHDFAFETETDIILRDTIFSAAPDPRIRETREKEIRTVLTSIEEDKRRRRRGMGLPG